jgi:hypothetical protein
VDDRDEIQKFFKTWELEQDDPAKLRLRENPDKHRVYLVVPAERP